MVKGTYIGREPDCLNGVFRWSSGIQSAAPYGEAAEAQSSGSGAAVSRDATVPGSSRAWAWWWWGGQ